MYHLPKDDGVAFTSQGIIFKTSESSYKLT